MQRSTFSFKLPDELIAQYPSENRSDSRLLVYQRELGEASHQSFRDLPNYLTDKDLLVLNNTQVMNARLFGVKQTGGKCELLVERITSERTFLAHMKANKSLKVDQTFFITDNIPVTVIGRQANLFHCEVPESTLVTELLEEHGHVPLPPYIEREDKLEDKSRYQTVYAKHLGAVAAPTAGLHFDETLLKKISDKGVSIGYLTLHVGAGTFKPVQSNDINDHVMHSEWLSVDETLISQIKETKARGGRVIAVGTTVVRSLETLMRDNRELSPYQGDSDIFIYPPYEFKVVDGIVTNFHLPESTLIMLVSAFLGIEQAMSLYQLAIENKYRFFSYGDSSLLL